MLLDIRWHSFSVVRRGCHVPCPQSCSRCARRFAVSWPVCGLTLEEQSAGISPWKKQSELCTRNNINNPHVNRCNLIILLNTQNETHGISGRHPHSGSPTTWAPVHARVQQDQFCLKFRAVQSERTRHLNICVHLWLCRVGYPKLSHHVYTHTHVCVYIYIYWPARSWLKTWALGGAVHGRCWKMKKWCWKKKCGKNVVFKIKKLVFGPGVW